MTYCTRALGPKRQQINLHMLLSKTTKPTIFFLQTWISKKNY